MIVWSRRLPAVARRIRRLSLAKIQSGLFDDDFRVVPA
jgi:hypothetical protein